ncbi:MAG: ATP-binding protein [Acidaminococcaceae bacterium]
MSIRRKLAIFVVALTVIPMFIILLVSRVAFNQQILENEKTYLTIAMKTARHAMEARRQGLYGPATVLAQSKAVKESVEQHNYAELQEGLDAIKNVCFYTDYAVIVDNANNLMVKLSPQMVYDGNSRLGILVAEAIRKKTMVFSEEVLPLKELFLENSPDYQKYLVKLQMPLSAPEEFLNKGLMGTTVVPIFATDTSNVVSGCIIVGDLANNDEYYPKYYSDSIAGSYLAISIDGIRISSNINAEKGDNAIGSMVPSSKSITQTIEAAGELDGSDIVLPGENITQVQRKQYFGKEEIGDDNHVFLDQLILNYSGKEVAMMGVGIPEERFLGIITDNNKMVVVVTLISLCMMLLIGNLLAHKISAPIVEATEKAKLLSATSFNRIQQPITTEQDEGLVLLQTFNAFAGDLRQYHRDRQRYLVELEEEHGKQKKLSRELQVMNEKLEQKVAQRTRHLHDAVEELRKADIAKSQFMANISHELRTPLNAIIGSAEILSDNILGPLNEKQRQYVSNVHSSGSHLLQLINDILDISKIATGKMNLHLSEFYIADVIKQTVDNVKSYVQEKNLEISVLIAPDDFIVYADAAKLKQIMYNLLSNAVKFTPNQGKVLLTVFKREEMLEVIVKDTGIGIAEENQERVFIEFEQVDNSYSREYEGTGLGLPLVKKLVAMHGGQVFLKSRLGVGTTVMFTIPLTQADKI